jgi:hypothetical protein
VIYTVHYYGPAGGMIGAVPLTNKRFAIQRAKFAISSGAAASSVVLNAAGERVWP